MCPSNGRRFLRALPLALATVTALSCAPAIAVDVSIYGHIDIGGLPRPPVLILPTPVIINPGRVVVEREPVYLHVPPGHRKNWGKHCGKYNACGERVYFVQEEWYERVYVPEYQKRHGHHDRHDDRHDDRDYERRHEHYTVRSAGPSGPPGHEKGHGKGHDKGHGKHKD
jgi:hypothetical protein